MDQGPETITTTDARAGATPHMTRYILAWGLALTLILFIVILVVFMRA